jgi:hypothetical protein
LFNINKISINNYITTIHNNKYFYGIKLKKNATNPMIDAAIGFRSYSILYGK